MNCAEKTHNFFTKELNNDYFLVSLQSNVTLFS